MYESDRRVGAVICDVSNGIGRVTLNRPDRLNAMNEDLLEECLAALEVIAGDDAIQVVVLTGAGRGFCAGGDMHEGEGGAVGAALTGESRVGVLRRYMRSSQLLREMPKVTIAAINGACAGAGLALASACDLRMASTSAVFKTAFASAGLSGDFGGTWSLTQILGTAKARELYLLDDRLSAEEAHRIGLVSSVHPPEDLLDAAMTTARRIADSAPLAIRAMKENLNAGSELSFSEILDEEARRHVQCMQSEDAHEAAVAFTQRRSPRFVGR